MTYLWLSDNNLTGGVPAGLFTGKPELRSVVLDDNPNLGGQLPSSFDAAELTIVTAINCGLTGSLPQQLAQLPVIRHVLLGDNQLDGTLEDFGAGLEMPTGRANFS